MYFDQLQFIESGYITYTKYTHFFEGVFVIEYK